MLSGELNQGNVMEYDRVTALPRGEREGLEEAVTFRLRFECQEMTSHMKLEDFHRQRELLRQKPTGGNKLDTWRNKQKVLEGG